MVVLHFSASERVLGVMQPHFLLFGGETLSHARCFLDMIRLNPSGTHWRYYCSPFTDKGMEVQRG